MAVERQQQCGHQLVSSSSGRRWLRLVRAMRRWTTTMRRCRRTTTNAIRRCLSPSSPHPSGWVEADSPSSGHAWICRLLLLPRLASTRCRPSTHRCSCRLARLAACHPTHDRSRTAAAVAVAADPTRGHRSRRRLGSTAAATCERQDKALSCAWQIAYPALCQLMCRSAAARVSLRNKMYWLTDDACQCAMLMVIQR